MTLKTQIASDMNNVFLNTDEFAIEGAYTPDGGVASTISGIFDELMTDTRDGPDGPHDVRTATYLISTDADEGIASPAKGDTVVIDSVTWTVDEVDPQPGSASELSLISSSRRGLAAEGSLNTIARS